MAEQKYKVVFKGEIVPNADREAVIRKIAALYNVDIKKAGNLFSGKTFVLQNGVSLDQATKFMYQFEEAGAVCGLIKKEPDKPAKEKAPVAEKKPVRHETCYRVVFRGEVFQDRNLSEVKTRVSIFYKVKPEQVEHLFSRKPVTIKDQVDFVTAVDYMKKFNGFGAICEIEPVEPPQKNGAKPGAPGPPAGAPPTSPPPLPPSSPPPSSSPPPPPAPVLEPKMPAGGPETAHVKLTAVSRQPGYEQIKADSRQLYELLTSAFQQVKNEFNIKRKEKQYQRGEETLGCLILLVIAAAVVIAIFSSVRWYWALLGAFCGVVVLAMFSKSWDVKYADVFIRRMGTEKQRNFPLFAVTLKKWTADLPVKDQAKVHLQKVAGEIIREKASLEEDVHEYSRIIIPEEPVEPIPRDGTVVPEQPKAAVTCPKCGSNRVTPDVKGFGWGRGIAVSIFLGPLAGAIAGSSAEGKKIYVCHNCRKKWNRV